MQQEQDLPSLGVQAVIARIGTSVAKFFIPARPGYRRKDVKTKRQPRSDSLEEDS
jgi:hypothetical protein